MYDIVRLYNVHNQQKVTSHNAIRKTNMLRQLLWALLLSSLIDQCSPFFLPASMGRICGHMAGARHFRELKGGIGVRCSAASNGGEEGKGGNAAADLPDPATYQFAETVKDSLENMFGVPKIGAPYFWSQKFYSDQVQFEDPLVRVSGLDTFKKIHAFLNDSALLTDSRMQVHDVFAAGKGRVRARFTLSQTVKILPWRPRVMFTGVSTLWINEQGLVTKHVDAWDSVDPSKQAAISLDALRDIMGPCGVWAPGPSKSSIDPLEITLLRRDKDYMIKKVEPYRSAEVYFDKFSKKAALDALNSYLNGANNGGKMLSETSPVFQCFEDATGRGAKYVSNVMPTEFRNGPKQPPLPQDRQYVQISQRQGGMFAVAKLNTEVDPIEGGWVSAESVFDTKANLRSSMMRDGITAGDGWRLARYQDVYGKGGNVYELWIPVESFSLRAAPLISAADGGVKLPGIKLNFEQNDEDSGTLDV